jgi:hypothetical protein
LDRSFTRLTLRELARTFQGTVTFRSRPQAWLLGWVLGCPASTGLEGLPLQVVTQPEQSVPRGVVARSEHYDLLVSGLSDCTRPGFTGSGRRVGVLVTLQARTAVQVPANPYYALLIDTQHVVHEPTLGGCTPALPAALLQAPQTARGWIHFDLPRDSSGLSFVYAPPLLAGGRAETRFELQP